MLIEDVQKAFEEALGQSITIMTPKHLSFGDFAVNVMQLKDRPSQEKIAELIQTLEEHPLLENVQQQGAFINAFLSSKALADSLSTALKEKDAYGSSQWGSGKTWELEHTSPNPNKAMHLGHLRNNIYSMALSYIWEKVGITVVREEVNNNRGIAIARLMWGYLKYAHPDSTDKDLSYWHEHQEEWLTPEDKNMTPGKFVDELYVKASADFEKDENVQTNIRQLVVDWEAKDEATWALWDKVLAYSYAGQDVILKRLGNRFDKVWNEHEHYQAGKDYVAEGLKSGVFTKTDEGTIITQLEKDYNLPDTVVQKSDGTSLYITQDIALTDLKHKNSGANHLFWVVGPEQTLALKQMFAVCEQLGIGTLDQFTHLSTGWMSLKGKGSMSSRKGNVIYIDDLLDEAVRRSKEKIRDPERLDRSIDDVAEIVGVGAVKYGLLRVGRNQDISFDYDESLAFEGNSGPYLQYAYARMKSILQKSAAEHPESVEIPEDLNESEAILLRTIPRFSEVVLDAAQTYSPHVIATYAFDLTQKFNAFYENSPILDAPEDVKAFRLALTAACAHVVKNSLALFGIDVLESM